MPAETRVGLIGFGRIGQHLAERIIDSADATVEFVCDPVVDDVDFDADVYEDPSAIGGSSVDLIVEAATATVLTEYGEDLLETSNVLTLSTTALADAALERELRAVADDAGTRLFVPHGAILGTDGLQDGRPSLDSVAITTRKSPANIDFSHVDVDPADIAGETTLYEGTTRGICSQYPRNVNSHATVAIAGLGFDETESTLIADPAATDAAHKIVADGDGTHLEIHRTSSIEGVTGSYTLDSIWGTVSRILDDGPGTFVV